MEGEFTAVPCQNHRLTSPGDHHRGLACVQNMFSPRLVRFGRLVGPLEMRARRAIGDQQVHAALIVHIEIDRGNVAGLIHPLEISLLELYHRAGVVAGHVLVH